MVRLIHNKFGISVCISTHYKISKVYTSVHTATDRPINFKRETPLYTEIDNWAIGYNFIFVVQKSKEFRFEPRTPQIKLLVPTRSLEEF